jgi:diguanylate cyclase (GGDEF)-like protein/hemerythrin-like metal-binding protein
MNENDLIYNFAKEHTIQASSLVALLMPQTFGVGTGVKGLDGRYRLVNKAMEAVFDQSAVRMIDKTDNELFPPEVAAQLNCSDQQIIDGAATASDKLDFSINDVPVQCIWLKFPIHGSDGRLVFIGGAMLHTASQGNISKVQESLEKLHQSNHELQQALIELDHTVSTDKLTGVWNRRRLEDAIHNEMDRLKRYDHPLSMMIIDIDFLKGVNQLHGRAVGDQVLAKLATAVQPTLRATDSLARWGGEEFVVLCPNTTLSTVAVLGERLRARVATTVFSVVEDVTVSVGVAECMNGEAWEGCFKRADAALHRANAGGGNQVQVAPETSLRDGVGENVAANFVRLSWRTAYECGHSVIDEQHRGLFNDANMLLGAVLSRRPLVEVAALVDMLIDHVVQHFNDEEMIIIAAGYPGAAQHAASHRTLVDKAVELANSFYVGSVVIGELFKFLAHDVVARHLLGEDRGGCPEFCVNGAVGFKVLASSPQTG